LDELQKGSFCDDEECDPNDLLHEKHRPTRAFFEAHDGGILSEDKKEIYFMGIIDTLTAFGAAKKSEYGFKSLF